MRRGIRTLSASGYLELASLVLRSRWETSFQFVTDNCPVGSRPNTVGLSVAKITISLMTHLVAHFFRLAMTPFLSILHYRASVRLSVNRYLSLKLSLLAKSRPLQIRSNYGKALSVLRHVLPTVHKVTCVIFKCSRSYTHETRLHRYVKFSRPPGIQ